MWGGHRGPVHLLVATARRATQDADAWGRKVHRGGTVVTEVCQGIGVVGCCDGDDVVVVVGGGIGRPGTVVVHTEVAGRGNEELSGSAGASDGVVEGL